MEYDKEINELKVEVAVMKSEIQNNYLRLMDSIGAMSALLHGHCEDDKEQRAKQLDRSDNKRWGITQTLLAGVGMLILSFVWQKITKG